MSVDTGWFKSGYSSSATEGCVEVRITSDSVLVRDSKHRLGPHFSVANASWRTFLTMAGNR
ncbi:DUF397 domain-containing protein [Actinosynnema sp. ALI-1.44]|uniref:DUF397 domain-containing protein n=1 Tax=Actinosynnema sp. ALI-1.44 TaxID=1933779 RepID=UPI00097C499B|nr:DUF397 domain-containing protein [Actinosynnema sp. ALI-1.44]ONI87553.1 DUF397 domain-containing protein [Actinosynnema sp. ALI-1.44]